MERASALHLFRPSPKGNMRHRRQILHVVRLTLRRRKSGTKEVLMASTTSDTHNSTLSPVAFATTKLKNAMLKVINQKGI